MSIQHAAITDPNIHEPKGASTASLNTTYVSNGVGSGIWKKISSAILQGLTGDGGNSNLRLVTDGANGFVTRTDSAFGAMTVTNNTNGFALSAAADSTLQSTTDYVLFTGTGAPWAGENNLGISFTTNRLTVPVTGVYQLIAYANISGFPTNTSTVGARFRINGTTFSPRTTLAKSNSAGDSGALVGTGLIALNANDFVQLYVASTAAGNLTLRNINFHLVLERQTA